MNEFVVTINGIKKNVSFLNGSEIFIDEMKYKYELMKLTPGSYLLKLNNNFYEIPAPEKNGHESKVTVKGKSYDVTVRSALQEKAASVMEMRDAASHKMEVKAPMPGMIIKLKTGEGDIVKQGDAVLILEAMKMENEVRSPFNGVLKKVFVKEGMAVEKGAKLFLIE
jgi:biotin carboxyl carrier protein